ncbi:MAG: phosphate regulon sensor histidine kinase PhoR [Burkholderiaceae bacterium]|jgi:two-component system phosphate regulon sensor histidine kinase PhoR|nr:phosphate regulon sensor histidine kinase PhoR [Burkholderiaceae bacterium]
MFLRLFLVLVTLLATTLAGWLPGGWLGAWGGAMAGALALAGLQVWRGMRLNRWLAAPDPDIGAPPPPLRGLWGEAAWRASKLLRRERRQAQENAQRLQSFLQAIQASPSGVALLDADGRIEWFNQTAAEHFGFQPGRDLLQHVGNLVRDPAFATYCADGDFSRPVKLPGRHNTPTHPVTLSVQLHPYGEGRKLLQSTDITTLAQAEAMRRDFVANVSHEIRTPLTVLMGFVETLQSLPLSAREQANYLSLMAAQASRMQMLVEDLLTLSRLEGSPPPSDAERVDLQAMMHQCEDEARALSRMLHASEDSAQELVFDAVPDFSLTGAAKELRSAISNLVVNAVRYTPAGGRIHVRWLRLNEGGARLEVTDSGAGIAPEHLPRLAERFYRVDRSRARESGGTGLGLAISKHVAQRHGGELLITSKLGKGSCFALQFPASRVVLGGAQEMAARATAAGTGSDSDRGDASV